MNTSIRLLLVSAVMLLEACGGGGSSSGGGSSTPAFPLAQAIANFVSKAENIPLTASGTVSGSAASGSATFSATAASAPAAIPLPFQSQSVFLRTVSIAGNVTSNNNTAHYDFTALVYYTSDYEPLGQGATGLFCIFTGGLAKFPTSVSAGQTGTIGTATCYQDDSQQIPTGSLVSSYDIKTNTSNTVIVGIIDKFFDTGNTLQNTSQANYQLDQNGNMTFLSAIVTIPASGIALTFTAQ